MLVQLESKDISCNHCKQTIEGELSKLDSVNSVEVIPENQSVTIDFDENATSQKELESLINDLGYEI